MQYLRWLITVTMIAVIITGLFSYKNKLNAEQSQSGEPAATIEAIHVETIQYQETSFVNGESQAVKTITLSNELPGRIDTLNMRSGDIVKKGQVLLEQDHSEEDARLIAAKANIELQKKTLNRYRRLLKEDKISEELVDQAQADLLNSESNAALIQSYVQRRTFVAPFDAQVGIHNLQEGQFLPANTVLTQLIGLSDYIWIDFDIPQIYDELPIGSQVRVEIQGNDGHSAMATIVSMEPMLRGESRHLRYRAKIANNKLPLKPNFLVKVTFPISEPQERIAIPNLAIIKDRLGNFVYKLEPEGEYFRAQRVPVELGERIGDNVIVLSGLQPGDYIANKGSFKLWPGIKTFVAPPKEETVKIANRTLLDGIDVKDNEAEAKEEVTASMVSNDTNHGASR
ncbi:efflux RND transporter periplasmic adaptor subunit [Paraneptunicella aestuarii]|uniref:efflux RND transporter periplasmic adaptor subunit n=1 Tax=Paraneptunicella aestuarii TaxID=2831148 RepID=UPI001E36537C|nr:efflux RND transporter periplasmic adaptor subunit [Paraneptunicella aestuarii]UAA39911.1 efflux RND transporter periplasmic adaptor subunit [Paraneptunicella aestuarii]